MSQNLPSEKSYKPRQPEPSTNRWATPLTLNLVEHYSWGPFKTPASSQKTSTEQCKYAAPALQLLEVGQLLRRRCHSTLNPRERGYSSRNRKPWYSILSLHSILPCRCGGWHLRILTTPLHPLMESNIVIQTGRTWDPFCQPHSQHN